MLHHVSFAVSDLARSAAFYDAALAPLGYARVWADIRPGEPNQAIGYGRSGGQDKFAIKLRPDMSPPPASGFHLAFAASSRAAVDAFHEASLAAGGLDNGAPGPRPAYGPGYYAAFVIDPDGYHVEAVFTAAP